MPTRPPTGLGQNVHGSVTPAESPRHLDVDIFWTGIRDAGIEGVDRRRGLPACMKANGIVPPPPATPPWRLRSDAPARAHDIAIGDTRNYGLGDVGLRQETLGVMGKYKAAQKARTMNFQQGRKSNKFVAPEFPKRPKPSAPDGSDWYSWQLYSRQPIRNCEIMRSPRLDQRAETPENLRSNPMLMADRAQELKQRHPPLPPSDPWKHEWYGVKPERGMRQTLRPSGGGLVVSTALCTPVSPLRRSASVAGSLLDSPQRATIRMQSWTQGRDRWRETR